MDLSTCKNERTIMIKLIFKYNIERNATTPFLKIRAKNLDFEAFMYDNVSSIFFKSSKKK